MSFKRSAFVALFTVPAICGFGSVACAEDGAKWASPNVAGMPGYKESPKAADEVHAPRPVQADPRYGGSYHPKRSDNTK